MYDFMESILFLLLFPLLAALILLLVQNDKARGVIVLVSALVIMGVSVYAAWRYVGDGLTLFTFESESLGLLMSVTEIVLCLVIIYLGIKHKKYWAPVLSAIQTCLMVWYEFADGGRKIAVAHTLYLDELSIIMILISGIVGGLITIYAIGYMRDFQAEHAGQPDRRPWFFFLMFVFLSAMVGIVTCNDLLWMFFFWEITTLCSFFLIGYTRTEEAVNNSFRQLILNLVGGIAFVLAIIVLGSQYDTLELNVLLTLDPHTKYVALIVGLLCLAGIVKAAQMPFHSWLLGAMVAPTPTSALLHSSTMVKAGVFLILKLSPMLGQDAVGYMVMTVGGLTFLLASMAAISQSNAKRVLAYSTIANLGLIVACGGVGTAEAVWAGMMLMVFHAVTKSLLFMCVGTAEHHIGSRDIEDMDGLFTRMPKLAALMIVGIAGMFLAPFGMLISKWAGLVSFVDSQNLLLIACVVFGSAVTAFYWTKWLGKLVAIIVGQQNVEHSVHWQEWLVLGLLTVATVALCFTYPLISKYVFSPYLQAVFGLADPILSTFDSMSIAILISMLALILIVPIPFLRRKSSGNSDLYLSGVNTGDNLSYQGSMGATVNVSLRNWYLQLWFGEDRLNRIGLAVSILTIAAGFVLVAGGIYL